MWKIALRRMNEALKSTAYGFHPRRRFHARHGAVPNDILRAEPGNFDALYLLGFLDFQNGELCGCGTAYGRGACPSIPTRSMRPAPSRTGVAPALTATRRGVCAFRSRACHRPRHTGALRLSPTRRGASPGWTVLARRSRISTLGWRQNPKRLQVGMAVARCCSRSCQSEEGLANVNRALNLVPDDQNIWNNRANTLTQSQALWRGGGRVTAGRSRSPPDDAGILNYRAIALFEAQALRGSGARFRARAADCAPTFRMRAAILLYACLHVCDWSALSARSVTENR